MADKNRDRHRYAPRLVSWAGALLLVAGSMGIATAASAEPSDQGKAKSANSQADKPAPGEGKAGAPGQQKDKPQAPGQQKDKPRPSTPSGGGGSDVSLDKPNDFQAQADPDGMENGGVDQPGGEGGVDPTSQDGNNGSGNDEDCEDDNNGVGVPGHCKERVDPPVVDPPVVDPPVVDPPVVDPPVVDPPVVNEPVAERDVVPAAASAMFPHVLAPQAAPAAVRSVAPSADTGVLPNTGAGEALAALTLAGLVGLAVGGALLRRGRATS